ncbi:MAG: hypothetical protein ABIC04_08495 [Nanoarchaeota archaeon]
MKKKVAKFFAVLTATAITSSSFVFAKTKDEYTIVGTPQQVEETLSKNYDQYVPNNFWEVKDSGKLQKVAEIGAKFNITQKIFYNHSPHFDNSPGAMYDKQENQKKTQERLDGKFIPLFEKAKQQIRTKTGITNDQLITAILRNGLEPVKITVYGESTGFTCIMGEGISNDKLGLLRGIDSKAIISEKIRQYMNEILGIEPTTLELENNITVKSGGMIIEHPVVEKAITRLNMFAQEHKLGFMINYKNIKQKKDIKKRKKELENFNYAMLILKKSHFIEYEAIKNMLAPTRYSELQLFFVIELVVFGTKMSVFLVGNPGGPLPEKQKAAIYSGHQVEKQRLSYRIEKSIKPVNQYLQAKAKRKIGRCKSGAKGKLMTY